eukprot:4266893-Alexandrium_andersonii.AAC.1
MSLRSGVHVPPCKELAGDPAASGAVWCSLRLAVVRRGCRGKARNRAVGFTASRRLGVPHLRVGELAKCAP